MPQCKLCSGKNSFHLKERVKCFVSDTQLRWHDSGCCDTYGQLSLTLQSAYVVVLKREASGADTKIVFPYKYAIQW
jgi:hypothetical protein